MAIARFLALSIFALAVALVPAAQCTTLRHAFLDDPMVSGPSATSLEGGTGVGMPPGADDAAGGWAEAISVAADSADEVSGDVAPRPPHRQQPHQKRVAPCPATCSPLACQAAMPAPPSSGAASGLRLAERLRARQEDGVADPRLLRIERPPRRTA